MQDGDRANVVFVSHSSADAVVANRLVRRIESEGFPCWIAPRDVAGATDYAAAINDAIQSSGVLVAIISKKAVLSAHCLREVELAVRSGIPILPVRLDDAKLSSGLEYRLATSQWIDAADPDFDQLFMRCLGSILPAREVAGVQPGRAQNPQFVPKPADNRAIVGREAETSRVMASLQQVIEQGAGRIILVRGGSGVGKSVLMSTIASRAVEAGFETIAAVCEPFHEGMAFFPIRELIRQLAGTRGLRNAIAEIFGNNSVEGEMAEVAELASVDPGSRRDALIGSFSNLCLGHARAQGGRPLLIMIDDMERIDSGTTDSLLCLAARLADGPVVLLGAYRSDIVEAERTSHPLTPLVVAAARSSVRGMNIGLEPMRQELLPDMVNAILGGEPCELPIHFLNSLWKRTEGNPLFVREVIHSLQEARQEGAIRLVCQDDKWTLTGSLDAWTTPTTVEELVRERLDGVGADVRAQLELAAVVGKRFQFDVLRSVSAIDEDSLLETLEKSINLRLLVEVQDVSDSFEFSHGLIREVLYNSLSRLRRKRLHASVADALTAHVGSEGFNSKMLVGEHLFQAERFKEAAPLLSDSARTLLAMSAASDAVMTLEKAIESARRSNASHQQILGEQVMLVRALVQANEYCRAGELAGELCLDESIGELTKGWVLDLLGDIEWASGRVPAALQSYAAAEAIAISRSDIELELKVVADLAEAFERSAERTAGLDVDESTRFRSRAEKYLDRQKELARSSSDSVARARACRNEAKRLRRSGNINGALAKYEEGLSLLDPRIANHSILISYAKTLRYCGRSGEARAAVDRVLSWSRQSGARRSLGIAHYYRAILGLEEVGPTEDVRADLETALAIHEEINYDRGIWEVRILSGEWQLVRGDRIDAIETFRDALSLGEDVSPFEVIEAVAAQLVATDEHSRAEGLRKAWAKPDANP